MQDYSFEVEADNELIEVMNDTPVTINAVNKKAKYFLPRTSGDSANGSSIRLDVKAKSISNLTFQKRGTTQNKNVIVTYVKVRGVNTGAEKSIRVEISKT
jgi:hypothetical protein